MRPIFACALLFPLLAFAPASALELTVRPSGYVDDEAARMADLDRRLARNDYLFRSICRNCSRDDRWATDAPFRPMDGLRGAAPREEQSP